MNQFFVIGRLVKDPELRKTESGKNVANVTLAVPRSYKNPNGEYDTDYINCVLWKGVAESTASYCQKGDLVGVRGRIQTRNYEDKDGKRVYVTEVVADRVQFLDSRNAGNAVVSESHDVSPLDFQNNSPMAETNISDDVFADFGSSIEISDDDIAF